MWRVATVAQLLLSFTFLATLSELMSELVEPWLTCWALCVPIVAACLIFIDTLTFACLAWMVPALPVPRAVMPLLEPKNHTPSCMML